MGVPGVVTHRLVNCVNMPQLIQRCGLRAFVETGILDGDGIAVALHYGFSRVFSCDIARECIEKAQRRFTNTNVCLSLGDSREFIRQMAAQVEGPALFWLDAHFPDHAAGDVGEFPLPDELATLRARKGVERDVIICDDMRCIPGDDNPTLIPRTHPDIAANPDRFIQKGLTLKMLWGPFADSHDVYLINEETGVLLLVPRGTAYRGHFRWRILRRPRMIRLH
ncbi:MAG: hypothetical protein HZA51_03135 [Planctomycetes bacterium]|nr:hypothetical protein [Planctomycetota bacterium]